MNLMRMIVLSSIMVSCTVAQHLLVKTNGETTAIPAAESEVAAVFVNNGIVPSSPTENIRLIVQLRAPSRSEAKIKGILFSTHAGATVKTSLLGAIPDARVDKEFTNVFHGFSVITRRENIAAIAMIDGVENVYPDVEVNTSPVVVSSAASSVPKSSMTASGAGVRIGVIDTGIDYLHEAFGSGFGTGFRVAGGFDFVNNDADPMDDNGHGTHVAGIIGGYSSTISAAAPNAALFAYKVLDKNGKGFSSSVIAAIDRALADSIDILNLSIGSPGGSPDDPLSRAVDRAVDAGIVVVVAAGNSGGFSSINSPGTARMALTVGAADGSVIASFSSKGPVTDEYQIKPNVVAPGVNILSAKAGGGYVQLSGTSMAAPFVTALAATVLESHPEWTAGDVINAVISGSIDLRQTLFSQGNGLIDDRRFVIRNFSSPAQLNFGFNPPQGQQWRSAQTVRLHNVSDSRIRYSFVSPSQNPALQFGFSPQFVDVDPLRTAAAEISIITNNLFLSNNRDFEQGYTGTILAVSDRDTIAIPYAFFKGTVLQLQFDEVPRLVLVHNRLNNAKTIMPKSQRLSLVVENGPIDVIASYVGSRYVVKENIIVQGRTIVPVSGTETDYPLSFQPIDEDGTKTNVGGANGTFSTLEVLVHRPTGFSVMTMGGGISSNFRSKDKFFSRMSNSYTYAYSLTLQPDTRSSYTYDMVVDSGISSPIVFDLQADDLRRVDMKYQVDQAIPRIFPVTWTSYIGTTNTVSVAFYDGKAEPLIYPFVQKTFHTVRRGTFPLFHQREAYRY
jgi:subtilisin family serine protease